MSTNGRALAQAVDGVSGHNRIEHSLSSLYLTARPPRCLGGNPKRLSDSGEQGQAEHTEELEVNPGFFVEIVNDEEVGGAQNGEVGHPDQIELPPHRRFELDR